LALDFGTLSFLLQIITSPAELFCFFLVVSLSVNLEFGYAGIPNFGKVLFVASGGFIAGSVSYRLMVYLLGFKGDIFGNQVIYIGEIDNHLAAVPLEALGLVAFMFVVAAGVGAIFGYLASFPAIRLREDYLGMLLLAAGEIFNIFSVSYTPFLGGSLGSFAPDPIADLGTDLGNSSLFVLLVLAAITLLVYLYSERVGRAPLGRTLRALRDNEVASEAVGKDNIGIRRRTLLVGSALAGIAGVMYLSFVPVMVPGVTTEATFNRVTDTFIPFAIVILGGAANNRGVLAGTFVYLLIENGFTQAAVYLGPSVQNTIGLFGLNNIEFMLLGSLVIVILLWRPQGLIPEKSTLTMKKSELAGIASSAKGEQEQKTSPPPPPKQ
jgi:branched-chain amino acid transport system permease protein